jgi:hypothetical protein
MREIEAKLSIDVVLCGDGRRDSIDYARHDMRACNMSVLCVDLLNVIVHDRCEQLDKQSKNTIELRWSVQYTHSSTVTKSPRADDLLDT